MLRVLLTILAIVVLPLQGMAVPHSHPGQEVPVGHDGTPHVHLHGHSHGHLHHTHAGFDEAATGNERPTEGGHDESLEVDGLDLDRSQAGAAVNGAGLSVNVCPQSGLDQQRLVRIAIQLTWALASLDTTEMLRAHHSASNSQGLNILCRGTLPLFLATLSLRL